MTHTLRNGQATEDRRLDRLIEFDERSRAYPITALLQTAQPRSYTWGAGPVTDQGKEGACVGHGWTGELTARPRVVRIQSRTPDTFAYDLYHRVQHRDPWKGCSLGSRCPIEPTSDSANYDGTSVLSCAQELQDRGFISEFRWAFGLSDLILAIGRKGPAVLGIPWHEGMYDAPRGILTVTGEQVGGHCIVARGVNVREKWVLLRNSWGPDWGVGGDARISFADLERLLDNDGEAVIPIRTALSAA